MIVAENLKVNRLFGDNNNSKQRTKRIAVIHELMEVLTQECNYEQNKYCDLYIIAHDLGRITAKEIIGNGFTHYQRVANIDEDKCLKNLRTTFITKMQMKYGDINLTCTVSDHSTEEVIRKHYLAQIEAAKKDAGFFLIL